MTTRDREERQLPDAQIILTLLETGQVRIESNLPQSVDGWLAIRNGCQAAAYQAVLEAEKFHRDTVIQQPPMLFLPGQMQ
jgi:hypothetical protein